MRVFPKTKMNFKLTFFLKKAVKIEVKPQQNIISAFLDSNSIDMSSQSSYKKTLKNMPFWQIHRNKNDKIKTIINFQNAFNTS
jgi:hypothetical protein